MAVLALAALLLFLGLGDRALWGPEGRWASVAREMRLSGNYFWPTINGEPYYEKPLLSYWSIAAVAHITGGLDEFAARLPSALSGLLGIALSITLARQVYGPRGAILAGGILATSFSYIFWSRVASADIETVTGVLAAVTLFFRNHDRPHGWWVVALWLVMALTSLTKGLQGFALPLFIITVYLLLADGWRNLAENLLRGKLNARFAWLISQIRCILNFKTLLGVAIAAGIYMLPFAISSAQTGSNVGLYRVFYENVVRFFAPFDHKGPIYLYTYAIFVLTAPWSLFLLAALVHAHSKIAGKNDRFVLTYFWATFVFFSLSGSRRGYYLLPILPAAAILMARLFLTPEEALNPGARRLMALGFILTILLVVAGGVLAVLPQGMRFGVLGIVPELLPSRAIFAVFWAMQVAALIWALLDLTPTRIGLSMCVVAYLSFLLAFVLVLPAAEAYRGEKEFAQAVRSRLEGDMSKLVFYRKATSRSLNKPSRPAGRFMGESLIFYLSAKEPIPEYRDTASLVRRLESKPDSWVLLNESDLDSFPLRGAAVERQADLQKVSPGPSRGLVLFRPELK